MTAGNTNYECFYGRTGCSYVASVSCSYQYCFTVFLIIDLWLYAIIEKAMSIVVTIREDSALVEKNDSAKPTDTPKKSPDTKSEDIQISLKS